MKTLIDDIRECRLYYISTISYSSSFTFFFYLWWEAIEWSINRTLILITVLWTTANWIKTLSRVNFLIPIKLCWTKILLLNFVANADTAATSIWRQSSQSLIHLCSVQSFGKLKIASSGFVLIVFVFFRCNRNWHSFMRITNQQLMTSFIFDFISYSQKLLHTDLSAILIITPFQCSILSLFWINAFV